MTKRYISPEVRQYLSELGKKGGSARSERKTIAVRLNAKKGGRPRKNKETGK